MSPSCQNGLLFLHFPSAFSLLRVIFSFMHCPGESTEERLERTADGHALGGGGAEGSVTAWAQGAHSGFPDILILCA